MAKKMGLGRGLSAILPDVEEVVESVDQVSEGAAPVPADAVAEIQKYKALLDAGVLTEEEFTAKKRQLLGI